MLYEHEATVEVRGPFPLDMLRYNRCWPVSEEDVQAMIRSLASPPKQPYRVTLKALSRSAEHWAKARWESFGATVVATKRQDVRREV